MTSKEFAKHILKIYAESEEQLNDLKKVKISDDTMINSDMEKTINAQSFQKIKELIRRTIK